MFFAFEDSNFQNREISRANELATHGERNSY